jgi:uncharacterized membrane protein (UPF0182 family)
VIMRLPGEAAEEFLLMLPFTPGSRERQNMIAWLAGRADGSSYGTLLLYKFPKDRLVYGPGLIEARIDQDTTISSQLTLWNQEGSRVYRGNLVVIPIGASTLYVEPIYLSSATSRLPELKRIVVASGNRLAMEPTLEAGLARIFGPASGFALPGDLPASSPGGTVPGGGGSRLSPAAGALASEARAAYERAMQALREGDFARFGEELKRVEERLAELEQAASPAG